MASLTSFEGLIQQSFAYLTPSQASQLAAMLENVNVPGAGQTLGNLFSDTMAEPAHVQGASNVYYSGTFVDSAGNVESAFDVATYFAANSQGRYVTIEHTPLGGKIDDLIADGVFNQVAPDIDQFFKENSINNPTQFSPESSLVNAFWRGGSERFAMQGAGEAVYVGPNPSAGSAFIQNEAPNISTGVNGLTSDQVKAMTPADLGLAASSRPVVNPSYLQFDPNASSAADPLTYGTPVEGDVPATQIIESTPNIDQRLITQAQELAPSSIETGTQNGEFPPDPSSALSETLDVVGKVAGRVGEAVVLADVLGSTAKAVQQLQSGDASGASNTILTMEGRVEGGLYGTELLGAAGAELGSIFGLAGTVLGGTFGGLVGGIAGAAIGEKGVAAIWNAASSAIKAIKSAWEAENDTDVPTDVTQEADGGSQITNTADGATIALSFNEGDALGVVEQDDVNGISYSIIYGASDASTTVYYSDSDGTGLITEVDVENPDGTSRIIKFSYTSATTIVDYSGPNGTGSVLTPNFASSLGTYTWAGGPGDFSVASNWYGPYGTQAGSGGVPGTRSNVSFESDADVSGSGNVSQAVVQSGVTLTVGGTLQTAEFASQGSVDVQGALLVTGILRVGEMAVSGEVVAEYFTSNALIVETGGQITAQDATIGGTPAAGTGLVMAGGTFIDSSLTIGSNTSGTSSLTVTGQDALWTSSNQVSVGFGGSGAATISDGATAILRGGVEVGQNDSGTLTVQTGAILDADDPATASPVVSSVTGGSLTPAGLTAEGSIVVEDAGSEFNDSGGTLDVDGSAVVSVTGGAVMTVVAMIIGDSSGEGVGTITIDGVGSALNGTSVNLGEGTLAVADGGVLYLGSSSGDQLYVDGGASLDVANGGTITDGPAGPAYETDYSYQIGAATGAAGTLDVSGANSLVQLVDAPLAVGWVGSGTLSITDGGAVVASEVDVAALEGSQGVADVDGDNSILSTTTLAVGGSGTFLGGGTGKLTISNGAAVTASLCEVFGLGSVQLDGGILVTDPVAIAAGGSISGYGSVSGDVTDDGAIIAGTGLLELTGSIAGTGTLTIMPGATLRLDGGVASGITIRFASGGTGTLELGDPSEVLAAITGQQSGDVVETVSCYAEGTCIETLSGACPIERLSVGTVIETRFEGPAPIRWIGECVMDCHAHADPRKVWPVRVSAGAFGDGLPRRDLWLSPDHAVFADGVLIPVKYLINGCTIVQEPRDRVSYWHIEFDRHDVILAEGLPCESYLDIGARARFGGGPAMLHPDFSARAWEAEGCAPLIVTGPQFETVRVRLLQRAAALARRPRLSARQSRAA